MIPLSTPYGENRKKILKLIQEKVFITNPPERIVDQNGSRELLWIADLRQILLRGNALAALAEMILSKIEEIEGDHISQIGGVEVAAIPLIAALLMKSEEDKISRNGFFIRKSRKKYGLLKMIEGEVTDAPIVLVDDLVNSGQSLLRQVLILEEMGKKVSAVFVILKFRDDGYYDEFKRRNIPIISLFELQEFGGGWYESLKSLNAEESVSFPYVMEWKFKSEGAHFEYVIPKSKPVLSDNMLYVGADNGNFYAIDTITGTPVWTHTVLFGAAGKRIFSCPTILEDTVFFGAYDGNFYALDKKSGKRKWVNHDADWIGSSPVVSGKYATVYVGMEFGFWGRKGGIGAFDIKTGNRIWQSNSSEYTHGSPACSERFCIVVCGSNDGIVYGLDAKNGQEIWRYDAGGEVKAACVLSESEEFVAFATLNYAYVVLETKTGKLIVVLKTLEGNYANPAWVGDGMLVGASLDKTVYAWSIPDGQVVWTHGVSARIFASPVIEKGKVYFGANDACLHVLDVQSGREVSVFQATERITNGVVIDQKRNCLYVPTFANEIIALSPLHVPK